MSVDLLDYALTEAWKRSDSRRRRAIAAGIARARGLPAERVQLRQRQDGRVAVLVDVPREQLKFRF